MNIIFFDSASLRTHLLPFTFTRPVADLRVGILTIKEKFETYFNQYLKNTGHSDTPNHTFSFLTQSYLQEKFPISFGGDENLYINGATLPTLDFFQKIDTLQSETAIFSDNAEGTQLIAFKTKEQFKDVEKFYDYALKVAKQSTEKINIQYLQRTWDIFRNNKQEIEKDFDLITTGRTSQIVTDKNTVLYNEERIFIEEGASIKCAVLNAEKGAIYIGKNASVEEGAIIRGSFALGEGSVINTNSNMRGDTTIGKFCKVGGEVSNCVFFGYSNKGHDGFLGNAVIGEWCNLGAATNCSNLKNNYGTVRIWNYSEENYEKTELQFCGLLMGDHSKSGICTMFNTATVVGTGANVFGEGFPPKFIPSFAWGNGNHQTKFVTTHIDALFKTAERMMSRRDVEFTEVEKRLLTKVFEETDNYRFWESNPMFS
ncbi:putative sugar nucleotidyl transferase [Bernardetia sp.]|uniref:putative sugar nucleotidyl transferase n=1 Tax=Bernardetia sp. TaxID=1937974 RepID=UPI0025BE2991|nr:putative sugar nucleotidyl transferase [Bernardetia sp.]